MRSNMLDSTLGPPRKKCPVRSSCAMDFVPPIHRLATNTRIFQPEAMDSKFILPPSLLTHLSEEVLVLILEYLDYKSLVYLSKTCRLFHRLCLSNLIWRHRCRVSLPLRLFLCETAPVFVVSQTHVLFVPRLSFPLCLRVVFLFSIAFPPNAKCLSLPFPIFQCHVLLCTSRAVLFYRSSHCFNSFERFASSDLVERARPNATHRRSDPPLQTPAREPSLKGLIYYSAYEELTRNTSPASVNSLLLCSV